MQIVVLNNWTRTVDFIEVNDDWFHNEFTDWLLKTGIYESVQEIQASEDELIETFLFAYCDYDPNNTEYLVNYQEVSHLTYKDFAR